MKTEVTITFCIFFIIALGLFSYQSALYFTKVTPEQEEVMDFLQGKKSLSSEYTAKEASHLGDVKKIILKANSLFYFSILIILGIVYLYRDNKKDLINLFKYGSMASLICTGIVFFALIINFQYVFALFHRLFFPQGNWIFPAESLLIQTFPSDFFTLRGKLILLQSVVISIAVFFLTRRFK